MASALVTGGTSGIGLAFATALAFDGHDLVLVARDEAELERVAERLGSEYGVRVETLAADLGDPDQVSEVCRRVADDAREVDMVVNNAGFGVHASLLDQDTAFQERAMAVMCTAVLRISNAAARAMVPRGAGTIINVGSASAWITTGNYSAIKRWVVSYTQALALELEGSGVQATVVNPGWVRTQFHARSGVPRPKVPRWVWVDVGLVAETALADAAAGRVVSIPSAKWRFALWIAQHGPQGIVRYISRRIVFSRTGRG